MITRRLLSDLMNRESLMADFYSICGKLGSPLDSSLCRVTADTGPFLAMTTNMGDSKLVCTIWHGVKLIARAL